MSTSEESEEEYRELERKISSLRRCERVMFRRFPASELKMRLRNQLFIDWVAVQDYKSNPRFDPKESLLKASHWVEVGCAWKVW